MGYLIYVFKLWTQTSMNAKYFVLNNCAERQHVEYIIEDFPEMQSYPLFAFLIEAEKPVYICSLMMTSKHEEIIRKPDFIAKKKNDAFQRHRSSIDVVAKK